MRTSAFRRRREAGWVKWGLLSLLGPALSVALEAGELRWLGDWPAPTGAEIRRVQVKGDYAYLAAGASGLIVVDVRDPAQPQTAAHCSLPGSANGLEVSEGFVYVAADTAGLHIFNIAEPDRPIEIGSCLTDARARAVQVVGPFAYVADADSTIQVYEVSDPSHPRWRGGRDMNGVAEDVGVVDRENTLYAYLANGLSGLQVFRFHVDWQPIWRRGCATDGSAAGIEVAEQYVYVACESGLVDVFDAAQPYNPIKVAAVNVGSAARQVRVVGHYAMVAANAGGLKVFSVANPANPVLNAEHPARDRALDVWAVQSRVYLADGTAGLRMLDFAPGPGPIGPALNLSAVNGRIEADPPGPRYLEGTRVRLTATPNPGQEFVGWWVESEGGAAGEPGHVNETANPLTVVMARDLSVAAYFGPLTSLKPLRYWPGFASGPALGVCVQPLADPPEYVAAALGTGGVGFFTNYFDAFGNYHFGPASGWDTVGCTFGVDVVSNYVYLADGTNGLVVVDLRDLYRPALVTNAVFDLSAEAHGIHVTNQPAYGRLAYVAYGRRGLQIFDVNNPARPTRLGGWETNGWAYGVRVVGTTAYVAYGETGLQMVDVTNPAHPIRVGGYSTGGSASEVCVTGGLAYVAAGTVGLKVLDVSSLPEPLLVGSYTNPTARAWCYGVHVMEPRAYLAVHEAGLDVVDVSDPAQPRWLATYDTPGHAGGVRAYGPWPGLGGCLAFLADGEDGLHVVQDPGGTDLERLGGFDTSGEVLDVQPVETDAYVAYGKAGLHIVDCFDPERPVWLGGYDTPGSVSDVNVIAGYAYLADGANGLQILELSDLTWPTWQGGANLAGGVHHLQIIYGFAYAAATSAGLEIADVTDPSSPRRWSGADTPGLSLDVGVYGAYAYVADEMGGLKIIDVSQPGSPRLAGGWAGGNLSHGLDFSGTWVYLADGFGGLQVLDTTLLTNVVRLGNVRTTDAQEVELAGSRAFVADGSGGVCVVDVSSAARPTVLLASDTKGFAHAVRVAFPAVYVADGPAGLLLMGERVADTSADSQLPSASQVPPNTPMSLPSTNAVGLSIHYRVSGPAILLTNGPPQLLITNDGPVELHASVPGNLVLEPWETTRVFNAPAVRLTAAVGLPGELLLRVSGLASGQAFSLEATTDLAGGAGAWQTVTSTNAPGESWTFTAPLPTTGQRFLRVRTH